MHVKESRNLIKGVAAIDLDAPPVEALCGHDSMRALFDELADVLHTPSRDAPAEFNGFGIAALFNARPPRRLADWDRAARRENSRESYEAGFRQLDWV